MPNKKSEKKQPTTVKPAKGQVRDYSNDPFFARQAEEAKKIIEKYGLPKEFRTKNDNNSK